MARSVHEQVCVERDALQKRVHVLLEDSKKAVHLQLEAGMRLDYEKGVVSAVNKERDILSAENGRLQKQVENLGRDVDILKGFNRELKQHGTSFELLEKLKDAEDRLAAQSKDMLRGYENKDKVIKALRDQVMTLQSDCDSLRHSHKVLRADLQNSEECRAALSRDKVRPPVATPHELPAGWWYGFDSEGRWWGCSVRPRPTKYGWWEVPPGQTGDWQKLEGMPEADKSAWSENCWQVM